MSDCELNAHKVRHPVIRYLLKRNAGLLSIATGMGFILLLTGVSLTVTPAVYSDPSWGFMAWRGTLLGHWNSIPGPNPRDIAQNTCACLSWWSPGQYLFPGIFSLLGLPIGVAIVATVAGSAVMFLLGWAKFVKRAFPELSFWFVAVLCTFRYVTLPFGVYNGGQVLAEAATPWLLIGLLEIPYEETLRVLLLAAALVVVAFIAKLSALIFLITAVIAIFVITVHDRGKQAFGPICGASIGIFLPVLAIYLLFLDKAPTPISPGHPVVWQLPWSKFFVALVSPWETGFSWSDLGAWLFLNPNHPILTHPESLAWFSLPVAAVMACTILPWQPRSALGKRIKLFSLIFYGLLVAFFCFLYAQGAAVGPDTRYYRPAGILFLILSFVAVTEEKSWRFRRFLILSLCTIMSVYGLTSFAQRAWLTRRQIDPYSRTNQSIVDVEALAYLRNVYEAEKSQSLFVVPSPDNALALPLHTRVLALALDFTPLDDVKKLSYYGTVPKRIYILMQDKIAQSEKGRLVLGAFHSYSSRNWKRRVFAHSTIFFQ